MATSPHVVNVTEATFQQDVIDYCMTKPVVIDLWATWCGPCKTLGPILEGLADEAGGAFRLAKIDVDANPNLAASFRAQSIPMVLAIFQGQLVDQFVGALPKTEIKRWLDQVLEFAGVEPPTAEVAPKSPAEAEAHWRGKLAKDSNDAEARLELGRLLLLRGDVEEGTELLSKIEAADPEYNQAQAALALVDLLGEVAEAGGEDAVRQRLAADADDAEARYLQACLEGARGRFPEGLEVLVALVGSGPAEVKDRAKKAAAVVFDAAGRGDERVELLRRKLARLLF